MGRDLNEQGRGGGVGPPPPLEGSVHKKYSAKRQNWLEKVRKSRFAHFFLFEKLIKKFLKLPV